MKDEAQLVLEMYRLQVARSEHYENLRSSATNLVVGLAAGLTGLATFDGELAPSDAGIGVGLMVLGLFGYAASRFHSQRALRHGKRAAEYRKVLDHMYPEAKINEIRRLVPRKPTHLNRLWTWVHLGIVALGIALAALAFG